MSPPLLWFVLLGKAAALAGLALGAPWPAMVGLFFGSGAVFFYHLLNPRAQGLVPVIRTFETERREVWLTIDDGPDPEDTPRVLALLAAHGARATFFLVGERAARRPDLVRAIEASGHEIGHHTHTHPAASFWCASRARLDRELDQGLAAFATVGVRPRWFRPPVGIKNAFLRRALQERDLTCVGWSARGWDTVRRNPAAIVASVMRRVRPGAIILIHEGPHLAAAVRQRALAELLDALSASAFRCVLPAPGQLR